MRLLILLFVFNFSFSQSSEYDTILNKIENQFISSKDSLPNYLYQLKSIKNYHSKKEKELVLLYAECFISLSETNYTKALKQISNLEQKINSSLSKTLEGKIYYLHYLILERVTNYTEATKYLKRRRKLH
ncbi:hypothetical protein H9X57_12755 [Flavobacterium piscinae]|uniref:hypothetical protein n=1 Tax=Flavobacterium piscinae TaxID=2506424 RepID=UPI001984E8DB|nr:hypothetical protein [Flavobacterium piscinae]MBC8883907.1 hypothetical protein [Flavobacterium piscinae]